MKLTGRFNMAVFRILLFVGLACLALLASNRLQQNIYSRHEFQYSIESADNMKPLTANSKMEASGTDLPDALETGMEKVREEMQNEDYPKLDIPELRNKIIRFIEDKNGFYGIYFKGLYSKSEFGINATEEFIAASTIKIPLNLLIYSQIAQGLLDPDKELEYREEFYEGGSGRIQFEKPGTKFTVRELAKLSIVVSDNIATNMLLDMVDRKKFKDYLRSLGGQVVDDIKNVSCPVDMGLYLELLYDFCMNNKELGDELLHNLENTVFNDRLPKYLPEGIRVAHKIGNQYQTYHDVGIVFAKREPYIICVMSKGAKEQEAYETIALISKMVYDFVEGLNNQ